ncbi:MAG: hypothetical protein GY798_34870 [Hyphomicrobiales bacterium]|nr:hypothetical protein [Hyphomicrobiales bacterium]
MAQPEAKTIKNSGRSLEEPASARIKNVDWRLVEIVREVARTFPYRVAVTPDGGANSRESGTRNHPTGRAIDIQIYDASGRPLGNFQSAATFHFYEDFAHRARRYQRQRFPELDDTFRFGGYFGGDYTFDQMHLDISGGGMSQGSWEKGLSEGGRKRLARINGGIQPKPIDIAAIAAGDDDASAAALWDAILAGNPPDISASMTAAAVRGDTPESGDNTSPSQTVMNPGFLPMTPPPAAALEQQQVADIQAILAEQGFDPGPIDGIVGPRTREAAAAFRKARGIDGGDAVDRDLARALVDTLPPYTPEPSGHHGRATDISYQPLDPGKDQVRQLQADLKARGQDPGLIDGVIGLRTRDAVRRYRMGNRLGISSDVTPAVLEHVAANPRRSTPPWPRVNPRRNLDAAPAMAFGTPQTMPPALPPLPTERPPRAVLGAGKFGPPNNAPVLAYGAPVPLPRPNPRREPPTLATRGDELYGPPSPFALVPPSDSLADRFDHAFAYHSPVNRAPPNEHVTGLPRPVPPSDAPSGRFADAFASRPPVIGTMPSPEPSFWSRAFGTVDGWFNPPFANVTLPPGPGAGLNSPHVAMKDQSRLYEAGAPLNAMLGEVPNSLPPTRSLDVPDAIDMTPAGLNDAPTVGQSDAAAELAARSAGMGSGAFNLSAEPARLERRPGLAILGEGEEGWSDYAGPTRATLATASPLDIRPRSAIATSPGAGISASPGDFDSIVQPAMTVSPQVAEMVRQTVSSAVDNLINGNGPGGGFNPFNGRSIPPTSYNTPNGFSGTMRSVSGPGPSSGGTEAGRYLGDQNWKSRNFDPVSGGSRYDYFTDPESGTGGYVDSQGDVHTYRI